MFSKVKENRDFSELCGSKRRTRALAGTRRRGRSPSSDGLLDAVVEVVVGEWEGGGGVVFTGISF